jgi:arginyl-tRNA synthetase
LEKYILHLFGKLSDKLTYIKETEIILEVPIKSEHGDASVNIAMNLARTLKRKPREIAEEIISNLDYDPEIIEKIEIAGPGFINFFFKNTYLASDNKRRFLRRKELFGRSDKNKGKKANVEFVSANPTGPLTVGHGRNAVLR